MSTYEADPTRFCTPATELVFALALAGLSGAECSVMLAAIGHCFGPPRWDLKGTLLKVSRYFLAKHLPFSESTSYAAIDSLVRRGLLRTAANKCLIINKRLHEWRDANGAQLFGPRAPATASMYAHLAKWPWFVEMAGKVPLGAGPLFPPPETAQNAPVDPTNAETVPPANYSGPPEHYSGGTEQRRDAISGVPEYPPANYSGPPEQKFRPTGVIPTETPPNEAPREAKEKEMAGDIGWPEGADPDCDRLVTYAATEGRLPPTERPKLAAMLATCMAQGVDPSTLVAAVEDYTGNDAPEKLQSACAYIRSRVQAPRKITNKPRRSYVAWCAQRPATPRKPTAPSRQQLAREVQAQHEQQQRDAQAAEQATAELYAMAAAFTGRPGACHLQVMDELRRAGDALHVVRLQAWRAEGAAPWRNLPESKRKSWARSLAAAELACRTTLAEYLGGGAQLETVTVKNPEA